MYIFSTRILTRLTKYLNFCNYFFLQALLESLILKPLSNKDESSLRRIVIR